MIGAALRHNASPFRVLATGGPALTLLSVVTMQGGQGVAKLVFPVAGPLPVAALRFGLGALILLAIWRPPWPTDRRTMLAVMALGTALAGVNVFIYLSITRIPLGLAVTIQFTGALAVALAGARRGRHAFWALLAAVGIVLIMRGPAGAASTAGLTFAVASAGCWGAYIVLSAHVGARTVGGAGLALATTWAALLIVPLAVAADPAAFGRPPLLLGGFAVALLCTVIANSLELSALRIMPSRTFGILVSLEPVVAAVAGLLLLGEQLTTTQWLAIVCIVTASAGATQESPSQASPPH